MTGYLKGVSVCVIVILSAIPAMQSFILGYVSHAILFSLLPRYLCEVPVVDLGATWNLCVLPSIHCGFGSYLETPVVWTWFCCMHVFWLIVLTSALGCFRLGFFLPHCFSLLSRKGRPPSNLASVTQPLWRTTLSCWLCNRRSPFASAAITMEMPSTAKSVWPTCTRPLCSGPPWTIGIPTKTPQQNSSVLLPTSMTLAFASTSRSRWRNCSSPSRTECVAKSIGTTMAEKIT